MEAAENLFLGRGRTTALTAERIFSRLCAVLEECAQGRESQERALRVFNFDLDRAPAAILRDVFKAAKRVLRPLRPPNIALGGVGVRHKVATLFMELLPKFHRQARVIFKEAPTKEEKDGDDRMPQR